MQNAHHTLRYAIISGSTRKNSQSSKVATYISKNLNQGSSINTEIVDLAEHNFPLWDETVWTKNEDWHPEWKRISSRLTSADATIMVVPEWNGMAPPQLMNLFQLCSRQELSHKPSLLVSVSAGLGGSYPIAELRMNSYKNTKICYIPEQIIVREVNSVLNQVDVPENDNDKYIRKRIDNVLAILAVYAEAFKSIRSHDLISNVQYPYGM